jgi:putative tryptophan/tyrosine transport system substrate-binding protein
MRRREFIAGLGSVAAWPLVARAQQDGPVRRIGVLMPYEENDPEAKAQLSAFTQGLAELGWIDGRSLRIDVRWATGNPDRMKMFSKELVGLQPDAIFVSGTPSTAALQRETRTIPIVFVNVADPVGEGFVAGLSRPAGNLTGFIYTEAGIAGKWVELLTEMAPAVKRVAIMFNPDTAPGGGSYFLPTFEAAARSLNVEPITAPVHSDAEIETFINSFGREPGGGLVVTGDAFMFVHRALIILLAARNSALAVYQTHVFVSAGGLLSYGPDEVDNFHRTASYMDRILRGAKPADLPVQLPVKFEMALNAKTAKALGLVVPQSILLRADKVIE